MEKKTKKETTDSSNNQNVKKLGLIALIGVVISAMMGGGAYNLPQNMAEDAATGPIIIAWLVTGIGVWFIANTFRILSAARPELTNGLYSYAEDGFGKFAGFFVAYGYWICNCFALVAYAILTMDTLNYFFPYFSGGNNIASILVGSVIVWLMFFITLSGARKTSILNIVGTIGKLIPLIIFILAVATVFKFSIFLSNFWGTQNGVDLSFSFSNVLPQVKNTMLVTLWLFIGIEGAVVISGRAKSQDIVRKATTWGYLGTIALYFLVSLLPLGVYSQPELSRMANPSAAAIMMDQFGSWGSILINVGVLLAVLSSWLVWMLMLGEMPLTAAKSGTFPKAFLEENKKGSPTTSLFVTTVIIQIVLVFAHFAGNAWDTMISITSVMSLPCYLLCTMYLFKITSRDDYPEHIFAGKSTAFITGLVGSIYGVWLIYAAGLNYMMIACIVYAAGIPLYIDTVKKGKPGKPIFTKYERIFVIAIVVLGIVGIAYSAITYFR